MQKFSFFRCLFAAACLSSTAGAAEHPTGATALDLTDSSDGIAAYAVERLEGRAFFLLDDRTHGTEMWVSDGTQGGTRLVRDLNPGEEAGAHDLSSLGRKIVFSGSSPEAGDRELWITDGTEEGTTLLADVRPGQESGDVQALERAGCQVFFRADDGEHGSELWATDGTTAGTRLVKDIAPGESSSGIDYLVGAGDRIFFRANDGEHGAELWTSDGTEEGTVLVKDFRSGPSQSVPIPFAGFDGQALVRALGEIWISDGTAAGTKSLTVHDENVLVARPFKNGWAFFASDEEHGTELWFSDGTPEGTGLMFEANPGSGPGIGLRTHGKRVDGDPASLLGLFDGRLYFQVFESGSGNGVGDLASTDGDSYVIHAPEMKGASRFVATEQHLLFAAGPLEYGAELFSTNGDIGDAELVENITKGGSTTSFRAGPIPIGDKALFIAGNLVGLPDTLFVTELASGCNCTDYETCESGRCVAPEQCAAGLQGSGDGPGGTPGDPVPGCAGDDCDNPTLGAAGAGSGSTDSEQGGGCSCRLASTSSEGRDRWALFLLLPLALAGRRQRRRLAIR